MLDKMEGSYQLALHEPVRSMLPVCADCSAKTSVPCKSCRGTGRFLSNLVSGDVAFAGNGPESQVMIGVEIKSVADMLQSMHQGRLQEQIKRMAGCYDLIWLLQYGRYRANPKSKYLSCPNPVQVYKSRSKTRLRDGWYDIRLDNKPVPYGYLEAFKCSPSLMSLGVQIVRVESLEEAAQWLGVLYRTWTKPFHKHSSMRVFDSSGDKLGSTRLKTMSTFPDLSSDVLEAAKFLSGIPGIRYERAIAIAKHFPSLDRMISADVDDWAEIRIESRSGTSRKLGKVLAKSIVQFLTKKRR